MTIVDMSYREIANSSTILEEQFVKSFMYGSFKVYIENRTDYAYFFGLLKLHGDLRVGNIRNEIDNEKYARIYDDVFRGKGVLIFISNPPAFSGSFLPAGRYDITNMADDNPHQRENWSYVINLRQYRMRTRIVGDFNHYELLKSYESMEKDIIASMFTKNGGDKMSRRVGNFIDEKTGETHWLEPSTVKDYPLPAGRIAEFGESGYRTINYILSDNETDKTIELVARVEVADGTMVESDPVSMDELKFAELLFESYSNDETFANKEQIKEFTEAAATTLAINAFKETGAVLNGLKVDGFGSIYYGDDRVATFDNVEVTLEAYSNNAEIKLVNSVSQTTVNTDKNPSVTFISNGKIMNIDTFVIASTTPGIVTQYSITTEALSVWDTDEKIPFVHRYDESVTSESPYMEERTALLASAELDDDAFEDRFDFLI